MHHVEILATSGCGHCRHITDVVTDAVLEASHDYEVHAIDLSRFPDMASGRYGLYESPIVVVDGRVVSAGAVPPAGELQRLVR